MQLQGKAIRVTVYIGENDHYQGKALYMAILQFLKKGGASGGTVTRGLAGFGAKSRIHTASIIDLSSDLPLCLEWIDLPETVERLLPQVRRMVDHGLITVEEIDVVQYAAGRRGDPLGQPVVDVMRREFMTIEPQTTLAEVINLLLQKGYRSLPVVDQTGHLLGILTDGDLLRRAGLSARLPDLSRYQEESSGVDAAKVTAADLMTTPVTSVRASDPLRLAVKRMVSENLKRLPVVDDHHHLVGWISRIDILRTIAHHQPMGQEKGVTVPAPRGATILDLMYRDVPIVGPQDQLETILQAIEATRRRRVVVVNEQRQVLGIITDGDLLRRADKASRAGIVTRLRGVVTGREPEIKLPDAGDRAVDLMTTPVLTILPDTPLGEALHLMLQNGVKRLPVVDKNNRLLGLLGRASLLQGLLDLAA